MFKRFICWMIGHQPRGPVQKDPGEDSPVLYSCHRCKETIFFESRKGWKVIKEE